MNWDEIAGLATLATVLLGTILLCVLVFVLAIRDK